MAAYGVEVRTTVITYAQPPPDFVRSQEARQLAVLQRAEQIERQTLAQARQTDEEALSRQQALARVSREQDTLQAEAQRAEARRRLVEAEASVEALRLAHLEERLQRYPQASQWEWEGARLEVARSLAGNTRAVLQVGNADQIAGALVVRDVFQEPAPADRLPQPGRPDESVSGRRRERGPAAGRGRGEPRPVGRDPARPGASHQVRNLRELDHRGAYEEQTMSMTRHRPFGVTLLAILAGIMALGVCGAPCSTCTSSPSPSASCSSTASTPWGPSCGR